MGRWLVLWLYLKCSGNNYRQGILLWLTESFWQQKYVFNKMEIVYKTDTTPTPEQVIELYSNSGLPRPTDDRDRIKKMYENSDLIVTAWNNDLLVGVSRSITDWVWCCYLADLAVRQDYKKEGIGKNLFNSHKKK